MDDNKIMSAEEFINTHIAFFDELNKANPTLKEEVIWCMANFAKYHRKLALEAALEEVPYGGSDEVRYEDVVGILDCYPEDLIK